MRTMILEARPWKRIAAFALDLLIVNFLILMPFSGWMSGSFPAGASIQAAQGMSSGNYVVLFLIFVLILLYFALLDYLAGQSIGMMAFGLHTTLKDKKTIPGLARCFLRNIAILPVFPLVVLWALDPLFLIIRKARLSDMALGCAVVEKVSYSQTVV